MTRPDRDLDQQTGSDERLHEAINYVRELTERGNDCLSLHNLSLTKRYAKGELLIHVHLRTLGVDGQPIEFCAMVDGVDRGWEWTNETDVNPWRFEGHREREHGKGDGIRDDIWNSDPDGKQEMVLVLSVEDMQRPQIFIPSLVRFGPSEDVHDTLLSGVFYSTETMFECIGGLKKGEGIPSVGVLGARRKHGSPKNIQRRTQVVDCVPDDGSPSGRRFLRHHGTEYPLPALCVVLGDRSIGAGFHEGLDFGYEITEMLFGPFDLDRAAGRPGDAHE